MNGEVIEESIKLREQKAGACRHRTFGTCVAGESCAPRWTGGNTTHDDWPANMILG